MSLKGQLYKIIVKVLKILSIIGIDHMLKERLLMLLRYLFVTFLFVGFIHGMNLNHKVIEDKVWESGATLLGFLEKNSLPLKLYYNLDADDEKLSTDIRVGTIYQVLRSNEGEIEQALIPVNDELELHLNLEFDGHYTLSLIPIVYKEEKKKLILRLDDLLSKDILKKSENFELSVGVEQLFKNIINFQKLRLGDKLIVFYTEKKRNGRFFGEQKIDAAMIEVRGKKYYQFLAKDGKYYNENGKTNSVSSFIVPCKYKRISSKFTKKRWHPILRRYRAHHGIDYATPTGTPIYASYKGKVIFAGRKGGYGNVIIMKHLSGYKTLYAHLSRFKKGILGKQIKTGKLIGYSGNTGRSTGPHLHFGLSINNRWINPASKIIFKNGLSSSKRKRFLANIRSYKNKIRKILKTDRSINSRRSIALDMIENSIEQNDLLPLGENYDILSAKP